MSQSSRTPLQRYGVAVLTVALATALTLLVPLVAEHITFALFLAAVTVSAWYGGRGPGLVATALSIIITTLFILPPNFSLAIGFTALLRLSSFVFLALLVSTLTTARLRAEAALRESEERFRLTTSSKALTLFEQDLDLKYLWVYPNRPEFPSRNIGKSDAELLPPAEGERLTRLKRQVIESGAGRRQEIQATLNDGEHWYDLVIEPRRASDGSIVGVAGVSLDITARKRAEAELRAAEERLRIALEAAKIYSWELDQAAQRIKYSANTADVMGFELSEDAAQTRAYIHPDDFDAVMASYMQAMEGEGRFVIECRNVNPHTGEIVWVRVHGARISGQGMDSRFVGVTQNITERKRAEEERERLLRREQAARATAESANRMKDEFLATVSHELRTPLTAILGWARLLHTTKVDEAIAQRAFEVIERNARAQAQLVEDLLDISRIVTGRLNLERHPVELAPVIETVLDSVRLAAEAKEIRLQASLDAAVVTGDAARLQQVVWNLLTNAIKFTPKSGQIAVQLAPADGHAEITISDTGIGIAPDFLPFVFDRFRQADQTAGRLFGGLGLGLAIVRHLVELHGGTVAVKSAGEGQGATFKVCLPLNEIRSADDGLRPETAGAQEQAAILAGVRVLVVEDDADTRDYLALILNRSGADVELAADADAALKSFKQTPPDVLMSDIGMPGADGYELIRQVREFEAQHQRARTPALALTAYARPEDRVRAHAAGYESHLAKPIEPTALIDSLALLAGRNGQ
jgi:PAS domain S-box-containing protein